jgi:hypothetical protein
MRVVEELVRRGGVAGWSDLVQATSRSELYAAVRRGRVRRLARGTYGLGDVEEGLARAVALKGVLCLESAALHWGWAVKFPPKRPQVAVAPNRKLTATQLTGTDVRRLRMGPDDVTGDVTSPERTLVDCLRMLEPDSAVAVADSALREGFSEAHLRALARDARGPGSRQVRTIAADATAASANPFESVLRWIARDVDGLQVRPQVDVRSGGSLGGTTWLGRPDLVDEELRIIAEADSFEWHGGREELHADARRYNRFVIHGWLVLRFSWEDVMFHPEQVADVLKAAVLERTERCPECRTAAG